MKIEEVIMKTDDLSPNQYSDEQKIDWLSGMDGKIMLELIIPNGGERREIRYDNVGEELLVPAPFAEDVYTFYLMARIAAMNDEIAKYNNYITLFNDEYTRFTNWYMREKMNERREGWRM